MRVMMKVSLPVAEFNELVRAGTVGQKIKQILDEIKPEAAYFTEFEGERGGIFVVDLKDPSQIPVLAEPWFLTFNAAVEFKVAMIPEDLQKSNLEQLGKKYAA